MPRKPAAPRLPAGTQLEVCRNVDGPSITVSHVRPGDVHAVLDWLEAVWNARGERLPGPDVIPGGTAATSVVDDLDVGERGRRRVGF